MKKVLIGILIGVLFLGAISVSSYNTLVTREEAVFQAWSDIDATMQRRHDLVPNLVATVKGYAKHEAQTLQAVTEARAKVVAQPLSLKDLNDPQAVKQWEANQANLSSALSRLMVVVEKYPDLKANQGFLDLQHQLEGTENRINVARLKLNAEVKQFNSTLRAFPHNMVNGLFLHLEAKQAFKADVAATAVPAVDFT